MKYVFLISAYLLIQIPGLFAQPFQATMYESFTTNRRTNDFVLAGEKLLRTVSDLSTNLQKCRTEIEVYNREKIGLISTIPVGNKTDDVPIMSKVMNIGSRYFVIYEAASGKEFWLKKGDIRAAEIDTARLTLGPSNIIANVSRHDFSMKPDQIQLRTHWGFYRQSPNRKLMLCFYHLPFKKQYLVSVFDENLQIIQERAEEFPDDVKFYDASVDNQGNVVLAYGLYQGKHKGKAETLSAIRIFAKNKPAALQYINAGNARPDVVRLLALSGSGETFFASLYNENRDPSHTGVVYGNIDPMNASLSIKGQFPFPSMLISAFREDGWAKKEGLKLEIFPHLIQLGNGTVVLTGEFVKVVQVEFSRATFNYLNRGSILTVLFNEKEPVFIRIPREMYNDRPIPTAGESFRVIAGSNKLYYLYNDLRESLTRVLEGKPLTTHPYEETVLVGAVVNMEGKLERHLVANQSAGNFLALTGHYFELADHSAWIPFVKMKKSGASEDVHKWCRLFFK